MTDTLQTINNTAELLVPESQEKWDILMDAFLSSLYGDYMQLPPEDKRENRHQIQELDLGD